MSADFDVTVPTLLRLGLDAQRKQEAELASLTEK
jgi:hypothetical protein